ncbi:MAG TPA: delta-60 repeat domain-containing protein, partial [Pyrinomonadaceae bacterium]|nr:delta-60 repeat domain-containing protein [Pyrinomonadaceae bacterium]
ETNITVTLYLSAQNGTQTSASIRNSTGIVFNLPNGNSTQNFSVSPLQVAELKASAWFFRINSINFPSGELRGQINALSANNAVMFPFSNGSLDTTFDTDGIVTTEVSRNNIAQAVAVQTDGKIIAAGFSRNALNNDFALARYNPNGSLDTSFDTDGIVVTQVGASEEEAFAVAIQPDGKIILAGQAIIGASTDIAVVRYNPNGSLDTTFDADGIVTTPIGTGTELARSIAIQTDGKIIVAGQSFNGTNNDVAVIRYNSDGSLDTTFDGNNGTGNGIVTTAAGSGNDFGYGVKIQPDGKIIVAGYYLGGTTNDALLIRYNSDGVLDTSFDGDGIVGTAIGNNSDEAFAVALQPNGKIVIAGCINQIGIPNDFLIVRYNSDGSLDTTFDGDGATIIPIGNAAEFALGVAIQADGKIIAAGFSNNGANNDFAVVRRNADGSPDTTFDGDGKLTTPIGTSVDSANGVEIQADGKIVVVGRAVIGATADFGVVRYGYGTNAPTNDGFFALNPTVEVRFDNAFGVGATFSTPINSLALPNLPNGLNLLTTPRNIQTSAAFSGDILVKFILPQRIDAANFNAAQVLQFENNSWIDRTANIPPRDFATRTIYARVSQLSTFAIVSTLVQQPANVNISGKMLSDNRKTTTGSLITMTDSNGQTRYAFTNPQGYYHFQNVPLRQTYIFRANSKRLKFAPQILTVTDEIDDQNFTAVQ